MPVTPFHMGPGVVIKAVGGRYFSLMVFGFSQVAMDVEPLVRMIRGDAVLHGFTHTYLGATLIGLVSAVAGAFVGTYSHVLLDSIMHSDMQPLAPLSEVNGLRHGISVGALHLLCVLCGVCGALLMFAMFFVRRGAHVDSEV